MKLYFNPLDQKCKSALGAQPCCSTIRFRIFKYDIESGEDAFSAQVCNLVLFQDGMSYRYYQMTPLKDGWTISIRFNHVGLFFYHFKIGGRFFACGHLRNGEITNHPVMWQQTIYLKEYSTPDWFRGGVMYQIFPDRFFHAGKKPEVKEGKILREWGEQPYYRPDSNGVVRNNDFFGGNFSGVKEKLDYLQQLGVTVLYFNPVFEASSNHRYDTGDYRKIDSMLGTEKDFDELIAAAQEKGIRIILDGVFNHTGVDSRYFNKYGRYEELGAYQSKESPYYDWYTFRHYPDSYDCWWGIETLPAVNESSPSYQKFMFSEEGVLKHWLRHDIGGYRLDVADELPGFFLKLLRKSVKEENPDALIIGEVWEDASNKIAYGVRREYFQGAELDSVMNYPLKDAIVDYILTQNADHLRNTIAMLIDNYPKISLDILMNILGTHDTTRILTVLGKKTCSNKDEMAVTSLNEEERREAIKKLKFAAVLQFMLPGVPCIYYGDEIGMEGYIDPFCRGCFNWDNIDWELVEFYQKLSEFRTGENREVFRSGSYREIFSENGCLVFERKAQNRAVYVYVNNSSNEYIVSANQENTESRGRQYREYFSGAEFSKEIKFQIKAFTFGIISSV